MKRIDRLVRVMIVLALMGTGMFTAQVFGAPQPIDTAVTNPARSDADVALDALRRPADVLRFFGIEPGMSVLDVFAGGGYYTEILSYLVGEYGSVTMYNNNPWDRFVMKSVDKRLEGHRLPNVERLITPPEELAGFGKQHDAAVFVLGMHDIYYADVENQWPAIDRAVFLQGIFNNLKPGGILGVIDHVADQGTDPGMVGKTLHRVDPEVIKSDLERAGFRYQARAYLLANDKDDHSLSVFAPELRWKSDRAVMLFRR